MRIIEKCWVDLKTGYQTALSLETRLKSEWERAIQVAQRRNELAIRSRQMRNRNITGILFLGFLFSCVLLWLLGTYFQDNRFQLWLYVCVLTLPGLVSGAFFLFYLARSKSQIGNADHPSWDLTERWWKTVEPKRYVRQKDGDEGEIDFLHSLSFLDDNYIAVWKLLTSVKRTSDTDVLLLGPGGIWVFEVKFWNGTIHKKDGVWFKDKDEYSTKVINRTIYDKSPDEQWLDQKNEIARTIKMRVPSNARFAENIQGGVVFVHPKVRLGQIEGNTASYGTPGGWHKRLRKAGPIPGFGMEERLQILDALIEFANLHERDVVKILSASKAAERLYKEASNTLQDFVSTRVK